MSDISSFTDNIGLSDILIYYYPLMALIYMLSGISLNDQFIKQDALLSFA